MEKVETCPNKTLIMVEYKGNNSLVIHLWP